MYVKGQVLHGAHPWSCAQSARFAAEARRMDYVEYKMITCIDPSIIALVE